jgi:hypothetical protein
MKNLLQHIKEKKSTAFDKAYCGCSDIRCFACAAITGFCGDGARNQA